MHHRTLEKQAFKIALIGVAALGGLVEYAALLRVRLSTQLAAIRQH